jgi:hypothetical protein
MASIKTFAAWIEDFNKRLHSQDSKLEEVKKSIIDLYGRMLDRAEKPDKKSRRDHANPDEPDNQEHNQPQEY